jgi:non-lysosomal glucosylceramidase
MYKYNFKSDITDLKWSRNVTGVKDKGLINCTWPKGGRPEVVLRYSDAIWTGVEYQVAAHLIYEGFVEEGFALVKAARDRYDGIPHAPIGGAEASVRNPWCEVECGGHYVRAMSSWSLLLALSGWEYDGPAHSVRFAPRHTPENFSGFFTATEGWGVVQQQAVGQGQTSKILVKSGKLIVKSLSLALLANMKPAQATVTIAGRPTPASLAVSNGRAEIRFASETVVREDEELEVLLG